ncbi:MAG TPA: hypothetical protein VF624_15775 [Tepidisphaeraceae bacterium]
MFDTNAVRIELWCRGPGECADSLCTHTIRTRDFVCIAYAERLREHLMEQTADVVYSRIVPLPRERDPLQEIEDVQLTN